MRRFNADDLCICTVCTVEANYIIYYVSSVFFSIYKMINIQIIPTVMQQGGTNLSELTYPSSTPMAAQTRQCPAPTAIRPTNSDRRWCARGCWHHLTISVSMVNSSQAPYRQRISARSLKDVFDEYSLYCNAPHLPIAVTTYWLR